MDKGGEVGLIGLNGPVSAQRRRVTDREEIMKVLFDIVTCTYVSTNANTFRAIKHFAEVYIGLL